MKRFAAPAIALAILAGACTIDRNAGPVDVVEGIVVGLDGDLTEVAGFTVRTTDGETLTFVPAEDGDFAFPLQHLGEHRSTLEPIVVEFQDRDGTLIATSVDDAD